LRNRALSAVIVLFLLAASLSLHLIGITRPWRGPLDSIGSWNSHNADFILTHGISATKLAFVSSAGSVGPGEIQLRHTHPSFIILWLALFRGVLGSGEWASRAAAIVLSLIIIFFTYLIARKIAGSRVSLFVLLIAVLVPMEAYWGRLPSEVLAASAMITGAVFFYLSYRLDYRRVFAVLFFIFHFLGCTADWIAYLLPAALFLFEIITRKRRLLIPSAAIGLNFIYFGLFILQGYWADGDAFLPKLFASATPWTNPTASEIALGLGKVISRIGLYFTIPLCVGAIIWLFIFLKGSRREKTAGDSNEPYTFGVPMVFVLVLLMWTALFPSHVIVHEVVLHPLSPFFPLSFGLVLSRRPRWASRTMLLALIIALVISQLGLVLARRYSQQNGYPIDYPLSRQIESVTNYQDHVITHVALAPRYYQFYCDRDIQMGINDIGRFRSLISEGKYTRYVALDLDRFAAAAPDADLEEFTGQNQLKIDQSLLDYLNEHYPSERKSFSLIFDLTREAIE